MSATIGATVASEWIKAWARRSTRLAYLLLGGLTVAFSVFVASATSTTSDGALGAGGGISYDGAIGADAAGDDDLMVNALAGILPGVIVAAAIGAVAISNEYGSGMIAPTFAATPRRHCVVLAKAGVVWLGTTVVGIVSAYASYFAARPVQRGNGYVGTGYPDPDLTDPTIIRAIVGTGIIIGLIATMAVGVGAVVKRTAIALPIVVASLVLPGMAVVDDSAARLLQRWSPLAGFAIQHTVDRSATAQPTTTSPLFYGVAPLAGLAVTAGYAAVAVLAGLAATRRRDI
jgi:ABC-2 type transport system permease protein